MPYYEKQPYIQPLHRLLEECLEGSIRVPRFQREGTINTWKTDQRGDLLDSIYRAFPIGTILLWSTNEDIATLEEIGGFPIPPPEKKTGGTLRLLLDGHQRLSTLIYVLGAALAKKNQAEDEKETWVFDLSEPEKPDNTRERFQVLKPGCEPDSFRLPMDIVLDRVKLNSWLRNNNELSEEAIMLAESLRDRIREYSIPVAVLAADNLDDATESFKRVNSSGTPMSHLHMVAALAYTKDLDLYEILANQVEEKLKPEGWEELDKTEILRVVAGILKEEGESQHPLSFNTQKLAETIRQHPELIDRACDALVQAMRMLKEIGVFGPITLPRSYHLIIPAVVFATQNHKNLLSKEVFERWFWLTTYGGVFLNLNTTVYNSALIGLRSMNAGQKPETMEEFTNKVISPLHRFDFRAARSKAYALAIAEIQDNGEKKAHQSLAIHGTKALETIHPKTSRSKTPAFVIVQDPGEVSELRRLITIFSEGSLASEDEVRKLASYGFQNTDTVSFEEVIENRQKRIEQVEKDRVKAVGLEWETDS